jgi:ATP-dependent DNA helicase RecQ
MKSTVFLDIETSIQPEQITDIGAIRSDGTLFHKNSLKEFIDFIKDSQFLCGHNIIQHDLKILQQHAGEASFGKDKAIDTLFLSPLLFPQKPYHRLLKDDKILTDERNNPLNDAIKARELFYDEVAAFDRLHETFKTILFNLTGTVPGFSAFFKYVQFEKKITTTELSNLIKSDVHNLICEQADVEGMIENNPVSLAYALSLINCNDRFSIMPPWVLKNHPDVERIFFLLRNSPCITGCSYCSQAFDPYKGLKDFFGYDTFRTYNDEPLQEEAIRAAINNQSLLCIFPTGGGKSLTFQIPALLSGQNAKALTVVISPLQSLMKDQVDNLEKKGITEAVTINAQLDPIERSKSIERVEEGLASILYISPESLRSVTIERLLLKRKIARFVIDEAHCFSSWGQDFRVDYLYIGDFIRELQVKKNLDDPIPVSCFTATAKPKVIEDIVSYFNEKLGIRLEIIRAHATRTNLHYRVYQKDNEDDKYQHLRAIIETRNCPVIVYVSRTRKADQLAQRLTADGFVARPYHGKLSKEVRMENQNAFMSGEVNIMVATSAFGMGVDKSDVGAVIHYDISDSLENYIQEAGRAGRDENLEAECFILFNEEDLNKHFILLNQTKIGSKEINQVWKAIKDMTKTRNMVSNSALEIARKAGWDDRVSEIETRVLTAIAALEEAGYIKRGQNMPRVYANSILSKTAEEALNRIRASEKIPPEYKQDAERIIRKLFSSKSKRLAMDEQAESRVDYIADQLGLVRDKVIRIIELLREEKILAQTKDLTAFIKKGENSNRSNNIVKS